MTNNEYRLAKIREWQINNRGYYLARQRYYNSINRKYMLALHRKHYLEHKQSYKDYSKKYRDIHKQKIKRQQNLWVQSNHEWVKIYKKYWALNHKNSRVESHIRYYQKNRLVCINRSKLYRKQNLAYCQTLRRIRTQIWSELIRENA